MPKNPSDFPDPNMTGVRQLCNLYNEIETQNLWEEIKNDKTNPLSYTDKEWFKNLINSELILNDGHSGASIMLAMNDMKFISEYGWEKYYNSLKITI